MKEKIMNLEIFKNEIKKNKIKTVLIKKDGKLIFEYYKNRKQKDPLQRLNSITKSILSILYGILMEQGSLNSLDIPIVEFFPFLKNEARQKQEITIRHLLTMTDGLDFPEFGEWNYMSPMNYQGDLVKFVLARPMKYPPGTHMNYSSGASHLLSSILQQITHKTCEEFANEHLFKPLRIQEYRWYSRNNINLGADGLLLKSQDLMKIGELMLNHGVYMDEGIVSSSWIKKITSPLNLTYSTIGYYGMHWWVDKENDYYFALGYGGQYLIVVPSKRIIVVIISEVYHNSLIPKRLVDQYLL